MSGSGSSNLKDVNRWIVPEPKFQPVIFLSENETSTRGLKVEEVSIAAHDLSDNNRQHWAFYLAVGGKRSVRIDATPSATPGPNTLGSLKAYIEVKKNEYDFSWHVDKTTIHSLKNSKNTTVGDFLDVLVYYGREKYEYPDNGADGCRYWVSHQIDLFFENGLFLNSDEVTTAKKAIVQEFYKNTPGSEGKGLVRGTYY